MNNASYTGFNVTSSKFDTSGLENPYYETSSKGDSLLDQMRNNQIVVKETPIDVSVNDPSENLKVKESY